MPNFCKIIIDTRGNKFETKFQMDDKFKEGREKKKIEKDSFKIAATIWSGY